MTPLNDVLLHIIPYITKLSIVKKHFNSIVDMVFQIIVEQWYLMGYNESLDLSKIKELYEKN